MKSGLSIPIDRVGKLTADLKKLAAQQVMVGVPGDHASRDDGEGITNAELAYIHTNGAPEVNIPARPFLQPGIEESKEKIVARLKKAATAVLDGNASDVDKGLSAAGQIAASAAQNKIRDGLQPGLKEATIRARQRRSAGSSYRRKAATAEDAKPLLDTGALLRAITYVLRKR